ncbi:MAG TPA: LysM peptidoglycan-binding domain-containing protein [Anaerolineae bacterium]|nr:LysM peptidoglycan-binding domain-containing protein [Anaerolineae bacterium]
MKKLFLVLVVATLLFVASAPPALAAPRDASGLIHVVQRGENLYRIALRYGSTVQAIAHANGIGNPNQIYVGQRLIIPTGGGTPPPPGGGFWYVVKRGDTLSSIGRYYGVSVQALINANHIANPNRIYAGMRLWIPSGCCPPSPGGGFWYTVRYGDTLSAIAWRYGLSPWTIANANGIYNLNYIYAGQRLWIPR